MHNITSKIVIIVRDETKEKKIVESKGNTIIRNFLTIYEQIFKFALSGEASKFTDIYGKVHAMDSGLYVDCKVQPLMALGEGDKPVSFDDYNLAKPITKWDRVEKCEVIYDNTKFKITCKAYKPYRFDRDTTIFEAGLAWHIFDDIGDPHPTMVDRIVLDTPITVSANRTIDVYYILEIGKS